MGLGEAGQHVGQVRGGEILRRAQAHVAGQRRFVEAGHDPVVEFQHLPDMGQQRFALVGQAHVPRGAFQQPMAERLLEALDLQAEGRLAAQQHVRRPGESAEV